MSGLKLSWLEDANDPAGGFPLNNLPFGVFSKDGESPRCATRLGDHVVDLAALEEAGLLTGDFGFAAPDLNAFMARGKATWIAAREQLQELFAHGADVDRQNQIRSLAVLEMGDCTLHLPIKVAEFTDFYACKNHATNVGTMLRGKDNALPPNWLHMPIAYNGRASTVVVSGTDIHRPCGQLKGPQFDAPIFAPSKRLDIELELGAVIGGATTMGDRVSVADADELIFGYVLLNDWSARDIQAWEYQPLGPFQAKAFATTISPWIVTAQALSDFRISTPEREVPLLDYLCEPGPMLYDIDLAVSIVPAGSDQETTISRTHCRELFYSAAQQVAHHTGGGCAMNVGDLLGSGTISGVGADECGSMLEMCWGGERPIQLPNGQSRTFIEDGDELILRGEVNAEGFKLGFGACRGRILPAKTGG